MRVKQRLLACPISGKKNPLSRGIMNCKGEHSAEMPDAVRIPSPIRLEYYLGVRRGSELVPPRYELFAKLHKVIDFTVKRNAQRPRSVDHRLTASRRKVDNRQAAVTEPNATISREPFAPIVGTAMAHRR